MPTPENHRYSENIRVRIPKDMAALFRRLAAHYVKKESELAREAFREYLATHPPPPEALDPRLADSPDSAPPPPAKAATQPVRYKIRRKGTK
jgi:hypothetical protein